MRKPKSTNMAVLIASDGDGDYVLFGRSGGSVRDVEREAYDIGLSDGHHLIGRYQIELEESENVDEKIENLPPLTSHLLVPKNL